MEQNKLLQIHWHGRFGNRMFQYAFGNCFAKKHEVKFYMPSEWEGSILFTKSKYTNIIPDDNLRLHINQSQKEMDNREYRVHATETYKKNNNDLSLELVTLKEQRIHNMKNLFYDDLDCMYVQHCFDLMNVKYLKQLFEFSDVVKNSEMYKDISSRAGTYDVVHLRRGDIANHNYKGAHSMISKKSYIDAIIDNGYDPNSMIWLSDNVEEASDHFAKKYYKDKHLGYNKWFYPTGEKHINNEIFFDFFPDFLLLYFARTIFRGNSAFSWWASTLSDAKVYSPVMYSKPSEFKEKYYCQENVKFVLGNYPHYMGSKEEGFVDINLPE